uniref:Putative secreted protein n=1 Tax=Anopheles darlingi TaxID=43151 RepID=A0A2M4DF07_ANODA
MRPVRCIYCPREVAAVLLLQAIRSLPVSIVIRTQRNGFYIHPVRSRNVVLDDHRKRIPWHISSSNNCCSNKRGTRKVILIPTGRRLI